MKEQFEKNNLLKEIQSFFRLYVFDTKSELYDYQLDAISFYLDRKFSNLLASRQVGTSTIMIGLACFFLVKKSNVKIQFLSHDFSVSKMRKDMAAIIFGRYFKSSSNNINQILANEIILQNKSSISFKKAERGISADYVFVENLDYYKNHLDCLKILPTSFKEKLIVSTNGKASSQEIIDLMNNKDITFKIDWHMNKIFSSNKYMDNYGNLTSPWRDLMIQTIGYNSTKQEIDLFVPKEYIDYSDNEMMSFRVPKKILEKLKEFEVKNNINTSDLMRYILEKHFF